MKVKELKEKVIVLDSNLDDFRVMNGWVPTPELRFVVRKPSERPFNRREKILQQKWIKPDKYGRIWRDKITGDIVETLEWKDVPLEKEE